MTNHHVTHIRVGHSLLGEDDKALEELNVLEPLPNGSNAARVSQQQRFGVSPALLLSRSDWRLHDALTPGNLVFPRKTFWDASFGARMDIFVRGIRRRGMQTFDETQPLDSGRIYLIWYV